VNGPSTATEDLVYIDWIRVWQSVCFESRMTFVDFCKHFSNLSICHRVNTSMLSLQKRWHDSEFHGAWIRPHRAGGCSNHRDTFFNNPQVTTIFCEPSGRLFCVGIAIVQINGIGADWTACMAAWHLPGGPVGPPVGWALVCSRPRSAMLFFQTVSSFPMSVTFFICRTSAETLGSGRRQYRYWRTSLGPIELTGPNTLLHTSPASSSCGPSLSWSGADWAAWLPGTCQMGRLVRRSGGPPRQMLKEGVERRRGPRDP